MINQLIKVGDFIKIDTKYPEYPWEVVNRGKELYGYLLGKNSHLEMSLGHVDKGNITIISEEEKDKMLEPLLIQKNIREYNKIKTIILAGDLKEFQEYFNSNPDMQDILIYASDSNSIRGIKANDIKIIGTFLDRKDKYRLYYTAKNRMI